MKQDIRSIFITRLTHQSLKALLCGFCNSGSDLRNENSLCVLRDASACICYYWHGYLSGDKVICKNKFLLFLRTNFDWENITFVVKRSLSTIICAIANVLIALGNLVLLSRVKILDSYSTGFSTTIVVSNSA